MPRNRSWGGGGGIPACLAGFQAHTQGGSLGGSGWGVPGQGVSRPTPKGEVEGYWGVPGLGGCVETCPDGYCCGRYASYWNAF